MRRHFCIHVRVLEKRKIIHSTSSARTWISNVICLRLCMGLCVFTRPDCESFVPLFYISFYFNCSCVCIRVILLLRNIMWYLYLVFMLLGTLFGTLGSYHLAVPKFRCAIQFKLHNHDPNVRGNSIHVNTITNT